jgi:hypothetical protein
MFNLYRPIMKKSPQKILGTFEPVTFPAFASVGKVMAKIDTGAYSGSLHCTKITEEKTDAGKVLHFSPFDHPETTVSTSKYSFRYVRSSNGQGQSRYFIDTTIEIQGETYPVMLSLADRSEMKWPMLIGRRFLRKYNFLVDVSKALKEVI